MEELTLPATIGNVETVTEFVNGQLEALDCPNDVTNNDSRFRGIYTKMIYTTKT